MAYKEENAAKFHDGFQRNRSRPCLTIRDRAFKRTFKALLSGAGSRLENRDTKYFQHSWVAFESFEKL